MDEWPQSGASGPNGDGSYKTLALNEIEKMNGIQKVEEVQFIDFMNNTSILEPYPEGTLDPYGTPKAPVDPNANKVPKDSRTCSSWTVILGFAGSFDAGASGTFESGVFRSKTCFSDGTVEYARGQYTAEEFGAGATATGADTAFVATAGYANAPWRNYVDGIYTNSGGDFATGIAGGAAIIRTLDGKYHGGTIELGYGTPAAGGHLTVGYGRAHNVEIFRNGSWEDRIPKPKYQDYDFAENTTIVIDPNL